MTRLPGLKISRWHSWDRRQEYVFADSPGVYLIAISSSDLDGQDVLFKDVVYIGMTVSRGGLKQRWGQFHRSIRGLQGHSGGSSVFRDKGHYEGWNEQLFVAAQGIECDVESPSAEDYLKMGRVAFLEYAAFARFYEETGRHPMYNKR